MAKLAPHHETTVPRLEFCAAVLAVEMADTIVEEMQGWIKNPRGPWALKLTGPTH